MNANKRKLIVFILIPLAVGLVSGILSKNSMTMYNSLNQPALSPPGWIFPVVWTILYILMGVSSYLIATSPSLKKQEALLLYAIQLFLNFIWSPIFFGLGNYFLAFLVLVLLWYVIVKMIRAFFRIDPTAALLQIPYLLWITFAGYLNLAIIFLN
ncbi:TspO/MBR family protein [Lacrimispora algidixylanolytica]|uniref:TspO protein n=1 Tax=Lacrimispora algidixylanolytica TaxID=94868 RepID=A0A419SZW6_9FIRM|nr:TspO/MBR family protein [Lacrimispora algidixylanolytica]RKD30711.1 TspO protein [Lacrimispora algidixylanolytica]